jgi:hypothetical protein
MFFALSINLFYKWLQPDFFDYCEGPRIAFSQLIAESRKKDKTKKELTEHADI